MDQINGIVRSVVYTNEKNGFTVCEVKSGRSIHTLVGCMPMLMPGESVSATGEWTTHPEYGSRFSVSECKRQAPDEEEEMEHYLSGGFIKGLGPSTAKKIVSHFKSGTFGIMQAEPLRLTEIKGITAEKALYFGQAFSEHENMRGVFMLAARFGLSSGYAAKIWKKFGLSAEKEILKNPYRLMDADIGLGFKTCDMIAQSTGIDPGSQFRLRSAVHFVLNASVANGNTYCPKSNLLREAAKLTGMPEELITNAFEGMLLESMIRVEKQYPDRVYTDFLFEAERYCARRLSSLSRGAEFSAPAGISEWLSGYEAKNRIVLDDNQKQALGCALKHGVSVITGGPGTGKTTIIKALIEFFEEHGIKVMLCAPTGRAAKRISETSGYEAKTVHRLLEVGYVAESEDTPYFARSEENPLETDAVIMDEASMIDTVIMSALLKAMNPGTRLILVGDVDQLPSVGPGRVLADIIECGEMPVVKLDRIFRQSEESMIVVNAHRINRGIQPLINEEESDFYFIRKSDAWSVVNTVIDLCGTIIPEKFGYDSKKDIQVLTPMRKGDAGVYNLNMRLQERLNPPDEKKPQKPFGSIIYRTGDRVMQIRNDYNRPWTLTDEKGTMIDGQGIYNGDMGEVIDVDLKASILTVRYDDQRICEYGFDALEDLEHAFAVTVHKSQGSEFPAVVIPVFGVPPMLVYRNLIYTAVTRARKLVVLVGNPAILQRMVDNFNERERFSGLKERLCGGNRLS